MIKILQLPIKTNYVINQEFDWKGLQVLVVDENKFQILNAGGIVSGYTLTTNPEDGYSVGLISGEKIVTASVEYDNKIETIEFPIQINEEELIYPNADAFTSTFFGVSPFSEFVSIVPFSADIHTHLTDDEGGNLSIDAITGLQTILNEVVPSSRIINTDLPLTGGGDLSTDRTFSILTGTVDSVGVLQLAGPLTSNILPANTQQDRAAPGGHVHSLTAMPGVLTSLEIITEPTVTSYLIGQTFNRAGLVVQANFSNGTTLTIISGTGALPSNTFMTVNHGATLGGSPRTINVVITHTRNTTNPATVDVPSVTRRASFTIEVGRVMVDSLEVLRTPLGTIFENIWGTILDTSIPVVIGTTRNRFWETDNFNPNELRIRINFNNGTNREEDFDGITMPSGFAIIPPDMSISDQSDFSGSGQHLQTRSVTVLFEGHAVTFNIEVRPVLLDSIAIVRMPNEVYFIQSNPALLPPPAPDADGNLPPPPPPFYTGINIQANFSNGSNRLVIDFEIEEPDWYQSDNQDGPGRPITVTYTLRNRMRTATFRIWVIEVAITELVITSLPETNYWVGDSFNSSGLVVFPIINVTGEQGENPVTNFILSIPHGTPLNTPGTHAVRVAYSNNPSIYTEFNINVIALSISLLEIINFPHTRRFLLNDTFDSSGLEVGAFLNDGNFILVPNITLNPANGSILTTEGSIPITISYTFGGVTHTTVFSIFVSSFENDNRELWQHFRFNMPSNSFILDLRWEERLFLIDFIFDESLSLFNSIFDTNKVLNRENNGRETLLPFFRLPHHTYPLAPIHSDFEVQNQIRFRPQLYQGIHIDPEATWCRFRGVHDDLVPLRSERARDIVRRNSDELIIFAQKYSVEVFIGFLFDFTTPFSRVGFMSGSITLLPSRVDGEFAPTTFNIQLKGADGRIGGSEGPGAWRGSSSGSPGSAGSSINFNIEISVPTIVEFGLGGIGDEGGRGAALGINGGGGGGGGASTIQFSQLVWVIHNGPGIFRQSIFVSGGNGGRGGGGGGNGGSGGHMNNQGQGQIGRPWGSSTGGTGGPGHPIEALSGNTLIRYQARDSTPALFEEAGQIFISQINPPPTGRPGASDW